MSMMPVVLGIDYSYTSPGLCVLSDTPQWYVHYKLKGRPYPSIPSVHWTPSTTDQDIPRYLELAQWVCQTVREQSQRPTLIAMEGYAFMANGNITQLAENGGVLKSHLYTHFPDIPVQIIAPTAMKKFATGKGNATKDDIWAAFVQHQPQCATWHRLCHPKALHVTSPMADVADAYFLALYGQTHLKKVLHG